MINKKIQENCILILDFGSQYSRLIARRVRELGVCCEFLKWNITKEKIQKINPKGIILSGGPDSTLELNSPRVPEYVFNSGIPVLGICYGMQTMAVQLGGSVVASTGREFGQALLEIKVQNVLINGLEDIRNLDGKVFLEVWMSHSDRLISIPPDFITLASTDSCPFAIIANENKSLYGIQFHPEVTHTPKGMEILKRFVRNVCNCKLFWKSESIVKNIVQSMRQKIGNDKVILGLSGGIDSSVAAVVLYRAIGKSLICVFIDNGMLCLNEVQEVIERLEKYFSLKIIRISAEKRFLNALKGISNPEEKRKIIGHLYIKIFDEIASKFVDAKWLGQGTIYSDRIESAAFSMEKKKIIKSHHNVAGLPKKMKLGLVEPLRDLFKDEVRELGLQLGIPHSMIYRHPFPGPGLSVRILGEVKKEYCDLLRKVDAIFIEELRKADLYNKIGQAFAIFLPVRSVSIMGDVRKYNWVVSLRAVDTSDFMTACWVSLPYNFLRKVSNRIVNEIHDVSRVVYDITDKPPGTIEWE